MDGLPGMKKGVEIAKRDKIAPIKKMVGPHAPIKPRNFNLGFPQIYLVLVIMSSFCVGIVATLYAQSFSSKFVTNESMMLRIDERGYLQNLHSNLKPSLNWARYRS